MQTISLVPRDTVEFFADMLHEIDHQPYELLRAATIPSDIHFNPDYQYLPESCLKNFFEVLTAHLCQQRLAWIFYRACKETCVPRLIALITERSSLQAALQQFCTQLQTQSTGSHCYLKQVAGKWWFIREKSGEDEAWFRTAETFAVICMAELLRTLTQDDWCPKSIGIQSDATDALSQLPLLANAQFFIGRSATVVEISTALVSKPVSLATPFIHVDQTATPDNPMSFAEQFRMSITPYLSMGKLPIKIAAEILRLNVRTLQRRLKQENIIYKSFIEHLVFEQVCQRLKRGDESITQIANRYGYSDAAHFSRSFKRIYGVSPSQYRKMPDLIGR
ncbi:helix-turn-helix transcriptional regulator [Vibrio hippocampi]|uniref:HTH-type transcriptional activator RhaS n=1 Tax=Vibrio hippocampi TaxID=654686 RepID=A0ABN8DN02_9VIBR|nr:helix-turn-helix transcriptional regulator [Vibrio hippocampi]CAH0529854.1 HTH-type transcriptional activator RhaS [Vibrio hippocampi]